MKIMQIHRLDEPENGTFRALMANDSDASQKDHKYNYCWSLHVMKLKTC